MPDGNTRAEITDWLERFRIPDYVDRRGEELSKGNQQRIQFIAAILHDPVLLYGQRVGLRSVWRATRVSG